MWLDKKVIHLRKPSKIDQTVDFLVIPHPEQTFGDSGKDPLHLNWNKFAAEPSSVCERITDYWVGIERTRKKNAEALV